MSILPVYGQESETITETLDEGNKTITKAPNESTRSNIEEHDEDAQDRDKDVEKPSLDIQIEEFRIELLQCKDNVTNNCKQVEDKLNTIIVGLGKINATLSNHNSSIDSEQDNGSYIILILISLGLVVLTSVTLYKILKQKTLKEFSKDIKPTLLQLESVISQLKEGKYNDAYDEYEKVESMSKLKSKYPDNSFFNLMLEKHSEIIEYCLDEFLNNRDVDDMEKFLNLAKNQIAKYERTQVK